MAVYADRVKETTTTTGTGTYSLAGAETGFQTFVAGAGTGAVVCYCVTDDTNWEVGYGTVTDATPDTLSRTSILDSSNSGAAVNWGAGTKYAFLVYPADYIVDKSTAQTITSKNVLLGTEEFYDLGNSGTAQTINMNNGMSFKSTLTGNVTYTFSNPPSAEAFMFMLRTVQGAGPYSITWPTSVDWVWSGAPPTSTGSGAIDYYAFLTTDGGTTWYGWQMGRGFA